MINKPEIIHTICTVLQSDLETLQAAFKDSHENATHPESVAENKYDTRGLEAAYLAHGQAQRVEEIQATLHAYQHISPALLGTHHVVGIASLVQLIDQHEHERWCWLGREGGGIKFSYQSLSITIITPGSPLGAALMGLKAGDVTTLKLNEAETEYEVVALY